MEDLARAFVDSGLAAVVRETLEKPEATLTAEDLLSLTQLDASGRHIIHLTGIDSLKNLESLSLAYNPVQDLSPLTTLAKLVSLDLDNCQLRNISALAELTQLIHLNLDNNALTDIQALSPLRRLEELSLVDNLIADIAVLDDLPLLRSVDLSGNPLNRDSQEGHMATLRERGVQVVFVEEAEEEPMGDSRLFLRWEEWEGVEGARTLVSDGTGHLYAGTGRSDGDSEEPEVLMSVDGGNTWAALVEEVSTRDLGAIDGLCLDATHPTIMLAHVETGSFIRSADGGATWEIVQWGGVVYKTFRGVPLTFYDGIVAAPQEEGVYYAFAGNQLYKSADWGVTWRELTNYDRKISTDRIAVGESVIYSGKHYQVKRSIDGGENWEDMGTLPDNLYILTLAVHPLESNRLYAATTDGIYVSEDKGRDWNQQFLADPEVWGEAKIRFHPRDPGRIYLIRKPQLLESTDAGYTWTPIEPAEEGLFEGVRFHDLAIDPSNAVVMYVATSRGVLRLQR